MGVVAEGILPQEVDMLPGDRRDSLQEGKRLERAGYLVTVEQRRQQDRVVGDHHVGEEPAALIADDHVAAGGRLRGGSGSGGHCAAIGDRGFHFTVGVMTECGTERSTAWDTEGKNRIFVLINFD